MTALPTSSWHEANQRSLAKRLHRVRAALESSVRKRSEASAPDTPPAPPAVLPEETLPEDTSPEENSLEENSLEENSLEENSLEENSLEENSLEENSLEEINPPAALDGLCTLFHLSPFERDLLLLCAGVELEAGFGSLCAAAQGDSLRPFPTFSLALAALPDAHWSALSPRAPLRRHRLIEIGAGTSLTTSPLRIDERILHCLVGVNYLDERLSGLVDPVFVESALVPSHQAQADRIAALWRQSGTASPVIQLCGPGRSAKRQIAAEACRQVGLPLRRLTAESLPVGPAELDNLIALWDREASLTGSALLLEADDLDTGDAARAAALARVIDRLVSPVLLSASHRQPMRHRPMISLEVGNPTLSEQRSLWCAALGPAAASLSGSIEELTVQFDIPDLTIRAASAEALGYAQKTPPDEGRAENSGAEESAGQASMLGRALWESCRVSARPRLDDLAQRIEPAAGWADLVLPETQRVILQDIAAHVRQRNVVYHRWGFASQGARGLGLSALFSGTSGTGKTLAAEVLARELSLDLYRIDLSAVVSKYIGESEKNLRRLFDAAEAGGAILLFDEADALFGKRTEVKESHDRYANQEVAYLLQRMETYRGLAILTTNLKSSLDAAFLRRLRYVVAFPFPDSVQRTAIWQRVFPASAPTEGLAPEKLARLTVAGGNIRNIALNAAFLAADAGEPIRMSHLLRASQAEYAKLEKTLTDSEVAGWL